MMEETLSESARKHKTQMEALLGLQSIDDEMLALRTRIASLHKAEAEAAESLAAHKAALVGARESVEALLKERREAERSAKERQEQAGKLGGQLFEVKTNEAYNTLQTEIKQKKQEVGLLEERVLEIMMLEDERQKEIALAAASLRQEEDKVKTLQGEIQGQIRALEGEIQTLQIRWDEAAPRVDREWRERYVRIRDGKGGRAMAKIENGTCTGCQLSVRPQAIIELKKYRTILLCEHCTRILFVD